VPVNEAEAARLYKAAADLGLPAAMCHYGEMLEDGRGVARNVPEAVRYFKQSSAEGCREGMFNYAEMLRHGRHVQPNIREAYRLYRQLANSDFQEACLVLCEILRDGEGDIPAYPAGAFEYAKRLADQGHFIGLLQYAELVDAGIGTDHPNPQLAGELMARAHSKEFNIEQYEYARRLETGKGARKDLTQAFKYYHMAALNRNVNAMYSTAVCYQMGKGTTGNPALAARWFKESADRGCDIAMCKYAGCLREQKNFSEALEYIKKAADLQFPRAYSVLGQMYELGEGVTKSCDEAAKWYQLAADRGDPTGMAFLGDMFQNGKGVPKDYRQAMYWYRMAADRGHMWAATQLGIMLIEGRGVERNPAEARQWFQLAADAGELEARRWLSDRASWG
jgi:TPR repeat protein